jgi:signal transduction histidine kinase
LLARVRTHLQLWQLRRELNEANGELRRRLEELERLNRELEDKNRGVIALNAELDDKARHLAWANELKTTFLSHLSHEFKSPLNSIQGLSRLLMERADGELTGEQEKQVRFIRKATDELYVLINDLLDLAKIEAGKILVHPAPVEIATIFSALRGMIGPLIASDAVHFVVEEPVGIPAMNTDEGKLWQILRNLLSNAIKFTEQGEIRLSARMGGDGSRVIFSVADTGIGIAPEYHELIFKEYEQIESQAQKKVRGAGLGLPLSRKLAELLGGTLTVESQAGQGAKFVATLPVEVVNGEKKENSHVG